MADGILDNIEERGSELDEDVQIILRDFRNCGQVLKRALTSTRERVQKHGRAAIAAKLEAIKPGFAVDMGKLFKAYRDALTTVYKTAAEGGINPDADMIVDDLPAAV